MKNNYLCWILLFSAILIINNSCSEEEPPVVQPVTTNLPPIAHAGNDQAVELPINSITLDGSGSTDRNNNISIYLWKKIAGPPSFTISTPNAKQTVVTDLTVGVYQFELTVIDSEGKSAKDICNVIVEQNTVGQNTAPSAFAGGDKIVILPTDFCWLEGGYGYQNNAPIITNVWKKISGPSTYILESPESLRTKVSKLGKGVYEFELTVTNTFGLISKDITKITVGELSTNPKEKIFNNLSWDCDWDWMICYIIIENIYSHLPPESFFKVYIQSDESPNWVEVVQSDFSDSAPYYYGLYDGNLIVYDNNTNNNPSNIKIVY